jgi:hypothetical protein
MLDRLVLTLFRGIPIPASSHSHSWHFGKQVTDEHRATADEQIGRRFAWMAVPSSLPQYAFTERYRWVPRDGFPEGQAWRFNHAD